MLTPVQFFKCLSDATRLRCMALLHKEGRLCVCELTHALDLAQPKISRHLAQLRHCDLLLDSREGQWVYYQIHPDLPEWAVDLLKQAAAVMENDPIHRNDCERLRTMGSRPGEVRCCA